MGLKKLDKFRPSRNGLRRRAKHLYECMIADRARLMLVRRDHGRVPHVRCRTFGVVPGESQDPCRVIHRWQYRTTNLRQMTRWITDPGFRQDDIGEANA
jgi:hypothetical protein